MIGEENVIAFISGGVRSGKSTFAERMALSFFLKEERKHLYYIATAESAGDREMEGRIKRHRDGREKAWTTIEEPVRIDQAIRRIESGAVVLIDCLTVWTSNVLFSEGKDSATLAERMEGLLQEAEQKNLVLILVSNDLNEEAPIRDPFIQGYVRSLETVHRIAVAYADSAIQVIAGQPVYWKGEGQAI